jgi:AAA ATPase-like protein
MAEIPISSFLAGSDEPILIGRENELRELESALTSGSSQICAVSGAPGTGKTELVQALARRAAVSGWTVVGPLPVTRDTREKDFSNCVETRALSPSSLAGSARDGPMEATGSVASIAGGASEDAKKGAAESDPRSADALSALSSVVLLLDPYDPSKEFDEWFVRRFLVDLAKARGPVVTLVAHRELAWTRLHEIAAVKLELRGLRRAEYKRYFEDISTTLNPPLMPDEVNVYVSALVHEPYLVVPFVRALSLSRVS